MKSQRSACSSLAAAAISCLLHAEINEEHTPPVEDPPPPVLQIIAVTVVLSFLLSLNFWKRSTRKRWIRACWLQWLESRTRLNIALLSPVGPQEGTGVHKWSALLGLVLRSAKLRIKFSPLARCACAWEFL